MFQTGVFDLNGFSIANTHDENHVFDDDVLSWFFEDKRKPRFKRPDGYVSNVGKIVIIHIPSEYCKRMIIQVIEDMFELNEHDYIITITIKELTDELAYI